MGVDVWAAAAEIASAGSKSLRRMLPPPGQQAYRNYFGEVKRFHNGPILSLLTSDRPEFQRFPLAGGSLSGLAVNVLLRLFQTCQTGLRRRERIPIMGAWISQNFLSGGD